MSKFDAGTARLEIFKRLSVGDDISPIALSKDHTALHKFIKKDFEGGYAAFYESIGLNRHVFYHENRNLANMAAKTGLMFEEILNDMLKDVGLEFKRSPNMDGNYPDFVLKGNENHWMDAKISQYTAFTSKSIIKYKDACDKLTLVYLVGDKTHDQVLYDGKVRVVSVYKLFAFDTKVLAKYATKLEIIADICESIKEERDRQKTLLGDDSNEDDE